MDDDMRFKFDRKGKLEDVAKVQADVQRDEEKLPVSLYWTEQSRVDMIIGMYYERPLVDAQVT